jgi:hypothetical protein
VAHELDHQVLRPLDRAVRGGGPLAVFDLSGHVLALPVLGDTGYAFRLLPSSASERGAALFRINRGNIKNTPHRAGIIVVDQPGEVFYPVALPRADHGCATRRPQGSRLVRRSSAASRVRRLIVR